LALCESEDDACEDFDKFPFGASQPVSDDAVEKNGVRYVLASEVADETTEEEVRFCVFAGLERSL